MKSINQLVLLSVIMGLVAGLICSPISVRPIFAEPPDPCFESDCIGHACNDPDLYNRVTCCWEGPNGQPICQTCYKDENGNYFTCTVPFYKGKLNNDKVSPLQPSGKASQPSTEKCPDNSAVDQNGNCTPTTQLPGDTSDNNKPNLRGNILNDIIQSQDSSGSGEEQEKQSND